MMKLLLLMLFITMTFTVQSRPKLGPPSIQLKTEISNLALVKLMAKTPQALTFSLIDDIHNKSAKKILIRTNHHLNQNLQVGHTYLIGYIAWKVNKPNKDIIPRPGGAVLMSLPGAEPAIFNNHSGISEMLAWNLESSLTSPEAFLPLILAGIKNTDFQVRNFFVTELVTRKSFMTRSEVKAEIRQLMLDPVVDWKIKHFIIANEGLDDRQIKSDWFMKWASTTLTHSSTQFDLNGSEATLIIQLLKYFRDYSELLEPNIISRWMHSNHTGVVENSLDVLKINNLDLAIVLVKSKLQQTLINDVMKLTLKNYLTRLINQKNQNSEQS